MWNIRSQSEPTSQSTSNLCNQCQQFFANPAMDNMCSSCYKKIKNSNQNFSSNQPLLQQQQVEEEKSVKPLQVRIEIQTETNKCWTCKKKIGYTGVKCRCGYIFCSQHRYAQEHNCSIDYEKLGKEKLQKENPLIQHNKLEKS